MSEVTRKEASKDDAPGEPKSNPANHPASNPEASSGPPIGGGYARYVLVVLVIVYVFNFIDRQILSILAEEIKADIGVTDSQIGFLYGTAFAVFYAIFGIPLGRLADVWVRKNLISLGLLFWSAMTALSGTAKSFASLATFRFGVGIGEASASPAAFSMLSDYFPPSMRATVISIYSSGIYIGAGIGVFLGGVILDGWAAAFPDGIGYFGLKGWQAAFFAVGIPGILMAIWVWTLREPVRGISEGLITPEVPDPFRQAFSELMAVLPPLTIVTLVQRGGGLRAVGINLVGAVLIAGLAWYLVLITGDTAQWVALGIGVYAAFSWAQNLKLRDPVSFAMVFGCPALLLAMFGFASISFVTYGLGFWGVPFFLRVHGASPTEVGLYLGLGAAIGGWIGVTSGGILSDVIRKYTLNGRLIIGLIVPVLTIPLALLQLTTGSLMTAYISAMLVTVVSPLWVGAAATTVSDLVMPRMRAVASAFYILLNTFIGLAMGPYVIGALSDHLSVQHGAEEGLRWAMIYGLGMLLVSSAALLICLRLLPAAESSRVERARAAGEPV